MKIFWTLLFSGTLLAAVRGQCPGDLADIPNAAFSPSAGCVWADSDESHRFDNYEEAIARCREVFGPEGRLIEIQSAEDQELAVQVMREAEAMFTLSEPELSYWWSGLRDDDDDGVWIWSGSNTPLSYSDWHPAAVPDVEQFNCMQFLSGTVYEGQWMTYNCYDDFLNTHALCQLKLESGPSTTTPDYSTGPTTTPATTTPQPTTTTTTPEPTTTTTTTTAEPTTTSSVGEIVSVTFITGSCTGCSTEPVEGGLKVRLDTESGQSCVTAGLDNPEKRDYVQGETARFTKAEEGMAECEGFSGGPPTGGSVTWTGVGLFAARSREICAELTGEEGAVETWCCHMTDPSSPQNVQVDLDNCALSFNF